VNAVHASVSQEVNVAVVIVVKFVKIKFVKMYSQKIIKRFKNPKFAGEIKNPDAIGQVGNLKCGDVMKIYLKVDEKNKKLKKIKFKTYGCIAAIAASDAMCELAKGKTLKQAEKIKYNDIIKKMGGDVPKIKIHCSVLGTEALREAIKNYNEKDGKSKR